MKTSKASFPPGRGMTKALSVWLEGYLAFRNLSSEAERAELPEEPQKLSRSAPFEPYAGYARTIGAAIEFASKHLKNDLGIRVEPVVTEKAVTTEVRVSAMTPSGLTFTSQCKHVKTWTESHLAAICDALSQVKAKDYHR